MNLFVDLGALALVAFISWWFWGWKPRATPAPASVLRGVVEIVVADGVYTPSQLSVPAGRETVLRFLRRDRSPCAALVQFDALGVSAELPVDQAVDVRVTPPKAGRYEFTCQMRMYRGTLLAVGEKA